MTDQPTPLDFARLGPQPGQRIVVTGGCGGIGRRLVEALLDSGVETVVLDLPEVLARLHAPERAVAIEYDARSIDGTARAFQSVGEVWGGEIDGVVHLPGFLSRNVPIDQISVEEWGETMDVNLRSAYLMAKHLLPMMRKAGRGAIVLTASGLANEVEKGTGTYSATKAGVIALTKGLARENAPNIRANVIAPGAVETAFLRGGTARSGGETNELQVMNEDQFEKILATVPLGRIAVVDDIVGSILFLLSENSRFITGHTLHINGGRLMV